MVFLELPFYSFNTPFIQCKHNYLAFEITIYLLGTNVYIVVKNHNHLAILKLDFCAHCLETFGVYNIVTTLKPLFVFKITARGESKFPLMFFFNLFQQRFKPIGTFR